MCDPCLVHGTVELHGPVWLFGSTCSDLIIRRERRCRHAGRQPGPATGLGTLFRLLFLGLTEELLQNQSLNRRTLCQPFVTAVPNLGYKETYLSEKNK
jgi:chloramphenicol 3-O-phosphotransferase